MHALVLFQSQVLTKMKIKFELDGDAKYFVHRKENLSKIKWILI